MDIAILIILIIVLIPFIYLFYFLANSGVLSDIELKELAIARRFWDTHNYLNFTETQFEVNKEFKSALNKNGQLYNCNEQLNNFPSIASALLKGKKHEWIIFAFARNKIVFSFYTNKGHDNQSVAPNLSVDYIQKMAIDNNADMILEFHNHPNAVLSASQQDLNSANYFGQIFTSNKLNFLAFVSGAGRFHQYGFWLTDAFYSMNDYLVIIRKDNGTSRSINFDLRKELKRKKHFMDIHLINSSTNITIQRSEITSEPEDSHYITSKDNEMDYLDKVLNAFKIDLKIYPQQNYIKIEKMINMGDDKNETWNKYYYKLIQKELGIFEKLEMIDHSEINKSFIFATNEFNINDLKKLVSVFYPIFGNDSSHKGLFNREDENQISTMSIWFGRMWTDYKKYNCAVTIFCDFKEPRLDLCVKW